MKTFRWLAFVIVFTRLTAYQPKPKDFSYGFRVVSFDSKTKEWVVDFTYFTSASPQTEGKKMVEVRVTRYVLTCLVGKGKTGGPYSGCDLEVGSLIQRHTDENAKNYLDVKTTPPSSVAGVDVSGTLGIVEGPEKNRTVQVFNIVKEELTFSHKYTMEEFVK